MTTATFYVNNDSVVYDDRLHIVSVVKIVAKRFQIALVTKACFPSVGANLVRFLTFNIKFTLYVVVKSSQ